MTSGVCAVQRRKFIGVVGGAAIALVWPPLAAWAQQAGKVYRIGYLALLPGEDQTWAKSVFQRLQELGYRDGGNVILDYRSAEGRVDRLPELAAELVRSGPDALIAGFGTLAPKTLIATSKSIPIVFTSIGDPVGAGIVVSLSEPGGNATGLSGQAAEIAPKRLQLLRSLVPGNKIIAVLGNPDTPYTALALQQVKAAAASIDQPLVVVEARRADQVSPAIDEAVKSGAASLLVLEDPVLIGAKQEIMTSVAKARLPAIYGPRDYAVAGGLMCYGPDQHQMARRAAEYVDKILRGARPASLPVEQPTKFELVINLKTAKTLGLEIPASLLSLADDVIE
jgi:putative ABC transport system substrate-binding protein